MKYVPLSILTWDDVAMYHVEQSIQIESTIKIPGSQRVNIERRLRDIYAVIETNNSTMMAVSILKSWKTI